MNPDYLQPHYSTKIWMGYYNCIKKYHGESVFNEICSFLEIDPNYLKSTTNWVSSEFAEKFILTSIKITGDKDIAKKAGLMTLNPVNINQFEFLILKIMPLWIFLKFFPIEAKKVNNYDTYKIVKSNFGFFKIELTTPKPGPLFDAVTKNAIGTFESLKDFFNLDEILIDLEEVNSFKRIISVRYKFYKIKSKHIVNLTFLFGLFYCFTSYFNEILITVSNNKTFFSGVFLMLTSIFFFGTSFLGKIIQLFYYNLLHHEEEKVKSMKLYESNQKLDRRYQESNLIRDLSLKLVKLNSAKEVINSYLADLMKRFGYQRAMVMLLDSSETKLYTEEIVGFEEHSDTLYKLSLQYPSVAENAHIFANILEKGETKLIDDMDSFVSILKSNNQALITSLNLKTLIVAPIQDFKYKYGLLIVGTVDRERRLNLDDKHLLENTTRMLSLFFQNARNFEKERILKTLFQKYVPSVVIEGIKHLENGQQGFLTPKNNAVTSIFVDMRDFTSLSENLSPERVVEMLNIYIDYVTGIIAEMGGIVDNLVGDGIVSFFPASSVDKVSHARLGILSALKILKNLDLLNIKMKNKGFPEVKIGIGVHSGNATVGNLGSDKKMNYTAVGDTINLASRLESVTIDFAAKTPSSKYGNLIFSSDVLDRLNLDIPRIELGKIKVKGKHHAIEMYMIDKDMAETIDFQSLVPLDKNEIRHTSNEISAMKSRKIDKKIA